VAPEERGTLLRRDAGRAGDVVAVTGVLGASAAGLHALQHPAAAPRRVWQALAKEHVRPQPQLAAGVALRAAGVRCAMDVSDGLVADLGKLCAASGVGARIEIERLPLHPAAVAAFPERAREWAASGGEDYQLLFCAHEPEMGRALAALTTQGIQATAIGRLTEERGVLVLDDRGAEVRLASGGWDHFGAR
jgi:thiamine-monophosphate kinase